MWAWPALVGSAQEVLGSAPEVLGSAPEALRVAPEVLGVASEVPAIPTEAWLSSLLTCSSSSISRLDSDSGKIKIIDKKSLFHATFNEHETDLQF